MEVIVVILNKVAFAHLLEMESIISEGQTTKHCK